MDDNWPFSDPQNVAVFTTAGIISGEQWIHYVSHDEEDGGWQFHGTEDDPTFSSAKLVALKTILSIDPDIAKLADLPLGWHAWRDSKNSDWLREKKA